MIEHGCFDGSVEQPSAASEAPRWAHLIMAKRKGKGNRKGKKAQKQKRQEAEPTPELEPEPEPTKEETVEPAVPETWPEMEKPKDPKPGCMAKPGCALLTGCALLKLPKPSCVKMPTPACLKLPKKPQEISKRASIRHPKRCNRLCGLVPLKLARPGCGLLPTMPPKPGCGLLKLSKPSCAAPLSCFKSLPKPLCFLLGALSLKSCVGKCPSKCPLSPMKQSRPLSRSLAFDRNSKRSSGTSSNGDDSGESAEANGEGATEEAPPARRGLPKRVCLALLSPLLCGIGKPPAAEDDETITVPARPRCRASLLCGKSNATSKAAAEEADHAAADAAADAAIHS